VTMVMYFIGMAVYFTLSFIFIWLNSHQMQLMSDTELLIGYISLGILIVTVNIFITERFKRSLGQRVLELKSVNKAIVLFLNCCWILFILVSTRYMWHEKGTWAGLVWTGTLTLWMIYITLFTGRFVMEEGLFCNGEIIRWRDIDYYEWKKGIVPFNLFSSPLHVWKKKTMFNPRLKLYVHYDQQENLKTILQQRGLSKQES
jgi:hypothetical protein